MSFRKLRKCAISWIQLGMPVIAYFVIILGAKQYAVCISLCNGSTEKNKKNIIVTSTTLSYNIDIRR